MRWASVVFSSCLLSTLCAEEGMFSEERLEDFYDVYVCEEKSILAEVDLSTICSNTPTPGPPGPPPPPPGPPPPPPPPPPGCLVPSSPPNPAAPPYPPPVGAETYMPVRILNNSGNADADMYFLFEGLAGSACTDLAPVFLVFDGAGVGSYSATPNGSDSPHPSSFYSKPLSTLPGIAANRYMYVPYINGRLYFSLGTGVHFTVNTDDIGDPDPANPSDPSYQTIYDKMEFNYGMHSCSGANQFSMDVTSVDFFGLPIYVYQNAVTATSGAITFPASSVTQGYYQYRDCIIENLTGTFATAHPAVLAQWNGLVQTGTTGAILRVLSPGESIEFAPTPFDPQYLDSSSGYSWADNLWTQTTAYYYANGIGDSNHTLQVQLHDGTQYNGQVQEFSGTFYFVFKAVDSSVHPLNIPWGASTSSGLFEGDGVLPGLTEGDLPGTVPVGTAAVGHAIDLSKMVEGLWMTGLIPAPDTKLFTFPYFQANNDLFFQPNTLLSAAGQNSGPWFDLYDKGLHFPADMNNVAYAYPWDDNYYDLPLGAGFAVFATGTYVGIILSPW